MTAFAFEITLDNALGGLATRLTWDEGETNMIFGAVKSGDASFCSIECARHNGCEPTRLFLPGEQLGEVCVGCHVDLDTGDVANRQWAAEWHEGRDASGMGKWPSACPYTDGPRHTAWHEGWKAGERDRKPATD